MADDKDKKDKKDTGKLSLGTGGATETERAASKATNVTDPLGGCVGSLLIRVYGPENLVGNLDSLLAGLRVNIDSEDAAYGASQMFHGSTADRNPCANVLDLAAGECGQSRRTETVQAGQARAFPDRSFGELCFSKVPPGEYAVNFFAPPGLTVTKQFEVNRKRTEQYGPGGPVEVPISGGQATVLEVYVELLKAIIRCYAYFESMENGKPHRRLLNGAAINASSAHGPGGCQKTNENGFALFELAPGFHTFSASSSVNSESDKCEYRLADDTPVVVQARPGESGCNHWFRYIPKRGRISVRPCVPGGSRGNAAGIPVAATYALLNSEDRDFFQQASSVGGNAAVFSELSAATYSLFLLDPYLAVGDHTFKPQWPAGGSMQVMVCCGQDIDLSLPYVSEAADVTVISGTLTDATGNPLVGRRVDLVEAGSGRTLWATVSNQDAVYTVPAHMKATLLTVGSNRYALPSGDASTSASGLEQFPSQETISQQTMLMPAASTL
jgi:hypothetical protein